MKPLALALATPLTVEWEVAVKRLLALVLFAATPVPAPQPAERAHRLGLLSPFAPQPTATYDGRRDLVEVRRELGYVGGRNLEVERRYADGRIERLPVQWVPR